jgi:light-regulated signal transduction histidine kinase (bacteriophytochrome)
VAALRALFEPGRMPARPQLVFTTRPTPETPPLDAVAYPSGALLALEIEARREPEPEDAVALVQTMMRPVQLATTAQAVCEAIVTELRAATGFDRVMMYRFLPDGSGAVVAEAASEGIDSFLGLHYPESDLPKPAIVPPTRRRRSCPRAGRRWIWARAPSAAPRPVICAIWRKWASPHRCRDRSCCMARSGA